MQSGAVAFSAGVMHTLMHNMFARAVSFALLVICVMGLALWIWAVVGTWHVADQEQVRNRLAGLPNPWLLIAKGMIVPGAVGTSSRVVNDGSRLGAHLRTALGEQAASPLAVIPQRDGRAILFSGGTNDGAADVLEAALRKALNATVVVFRSGGDWLRERALVVDVIRRHHLRTYVERACVSVCTIAFLAGEDCAAAPSTRSGFHRPYMVGAEHDQNSGATDSELWRAYSDAGLLDAFVCRVQDTPFDQMRFPTAQELLADHVVTRASPGDEYAAMATQLNTREALAVELRSVPLYAALERKYPAYFSRSIDTLWPGLQRNVIDAQAMTLLREQTGKLYRALIPTAPNALLLTNAQLALEQAQVLQRVSPEACVAYLDSTPRVSAAAARLPRTLVTRKQTLLSDLVQTADPDHVSVVTHAQSLPVLQLAVATFLPAQQCVSIVPALRHSMPSAERCQAPIDPSRSILALPEAERALALRGMYADTSTPGSQQGPSG